VTCGVSGVATKVKESNNSVMLNDAVGILLAHASNSSTQSRDVEQCTRWSAKSSGWRGGSERPVSVWKGTARWLVVSVFLF
jgi:hypothetical protein